MKNLSNNLIATVMVFFMSASIAIAQETKTLDVDISTDKGGNWYAQPWVWIVGAAVFLLLMVALMRGNSNK